MNIFKLIRWKNLLMITLVKIFVKYALLEPFGAQTSLNIWGVFVLILATICIAASGNIINDINDIETDFINKPNKNHCWKVYFRKKQLTTCSLLSI
ncbi:MAG: hypothetical protein ACO3VF_03425 [Tamlana sp.]